MPGPRFAKRINSFASNAKDYAKRDDGLMTASV